MAIKVPAEIINSTNDFVSFCVKPYGKKLPKTKISRRNCYMTYMQSLTQNIFYLVPQAALDAPNYKPLYERKNPKATLLDGDRYLKFMRMCREHGILPRRSKAAVTKNGHNILILDGTSSDRHQMYASLCLYRFCDTSSRMIWQIVEHMEKLKGITFWQALHYSLITESNINWNHSFVYIVNAAAFVRDYSYAGLRFKSLNLASSLAIKQMFGMTPSARSVLKGTCLAAIDSIADKLQIKDEPLVISDIDDLLTDQYTELYTSNITDPAELLKMYKSLSEKVK